MTYKTANHAKLCIALRLEKITMFNEQTETYLHTHSHTPARLYIHAHKPLPETHHPLRRFVLDTQTHTVTGLSWSSNPRTQFFTESTLVIKDKQKTHYLYPHLTPLVKTISTSHLLCTPSKLRGKPTHTPTPFHSKLILLSKQASSSRQRQWVPFSVSSVKRETLLFTDEWSLLMKRRALFTATPFIYRPVFQVVIEGHSTTLPHPPHPLNLTHKPPPSHPLLNYTPPSPEHTYTLSPLSIPCRSLSCFILLSSFRLVS